MPRAPYSVKSYPALYKGIVEDNTDPQKLGRCKIRVPAIHGELNYPVSILPWARPLALTPVNNKRGSVLIPDVGDVVWVLFEGSQRDFPVYFGGTYSTEDIEIEEGRVDFYIEEDDSISYNRNTRTYDIKIGERHIVVSPENISIKGDVLIEGDMQVSGSISSKGVTLDTHRHSTTSGDTSTPIR